MKKIKENVEMKETFSEKFLNFLDRHECSFVIVIGLLISIAFTYNNYLVPYDYLWNFGNLYKLHLGFEIYNEVNIIQTPIFFWIGELFFKVFEANFLTYNIYNSFLIFGLFIVLYITFKEFVKNKLAILSVIVLIMTLASRNLFGINGPNYNVVSLILIFLIILNYLKHKDNDMQKVYNGLLAGITLFTYQKAGAAAVVGITLYEFVSRKDLKKSMKNLIITAFSMIIVVELFLIYETKIGGLNNFIDMTLLSISEFSNNIRCDYPSIILLAFIFVPTVGFAFFLLKKKKGGNRLLLILSFSIGNLLYLYPIINEYHTAIGLMTAFIMGIYESETVFEDLLENKKIIKTDIAILFILIAILITYSIGNTITYVLELKQQDKNEPFYGAIFTEEFKENIEDVNSYIEEEKNKGNKVKILSSYAYYYKSTYEEFNNYLDMPLVGNFGSRGSSVLIDFIKNSDDMILLVQNKEESEYEMYQFPKNVREFVYNNYKKIGILHNYDIYEIKNNENKY